MSVNRGPDSGPGPETPGYIGVDTFGHDLFDEEPGRDDLADPAEAEDDLPDWAQAQADKGLCAVIDGWCVTHTRTADIGHWYATRPPGTDTGD